MSSVGGGGGVGGLLPIFFLLFSFPCSVDHERVWPPCKVVFGGLATNTLNVRLQPMIPPKRFDIFPPDWGMPRRSRSILIFL